MPIALIADAHLSGPGGPAGPLVEQLRALPDQGCRRLVLMGDLFQAWVGFRSFETEDVRAVVARPDLLLADEPTGNVDPDMGGRLIRLFGELNKLGTTVLIATHDRSLIESERAREMRLVDGRLIELRSIWT